MKPPRQKIYYKTELKFKLEGRFPTPLPQVPLDASRSGASLITIKFLLDFFLYKNCKKKYL